MVEFKDGGRSDTIGTHWNTASSVVALQFSSKIVKIVR